MNHISIHIRDQHGNELEIQRVIDNIGNWEIVVELPDRAAELLRAPVQSEQKCPVCEMGVMREVLHCEYCENIEDLAGISNRSDGG